MTFDIQDVETFIPVYQDTTEPGREFQSLLTKTGFSVRKCEAVEFSYTFSNKNQLLAARNNSRSSQQFPKAARSGQKLRKSNFSRFYWARGRSTEPG